MELAGSIGVISTEQVGFEPTDGCSRHTALQASAISLSATAPKVKGSERRANLLFTTLFLFKEQLTRNYSKYAILWQGDFACNIANLLYNQCG